MKKISLFLIPIAVLFFWGAVNHQALGKETDCQSLCASDVKLGFDVNECNANCEEVLNKIPETCESLCASDVAKGMYTDISDCIDPCVSVSLELSAQEDIEKDCQEYCQDNFTGSLANKCVSPCIEHKQALLSQLDIIKSPTTPASGGIFSFPNPLQMDTIQELIQAILKWMFIFSVPIAVFFILYAGYLYMTSGGDTKKLDQAKKTILYTLIGFAIILLANSIPYLINDILGGKTDSGVTPTSSSESATGDETPTGSDNEPLMACYRDCEDSFTSDATGSEAGALSRYTQCQEECDTHFQGTP